MRRRVGLIGAAIVAVSPGADLVLPGRPRLLARLPAHRALLPVLRQGPARAAPGDAARLGGQLGPRSRAPTTSPASWSSPRPPCCCSGAASGAASRRRCWSSSPPPACCCRSRSSRPNTPTPSWIAEQPLGERLERAGAKLVGNDNGDEHGARQPGPIPLGVPAALALAGVLMLVLLGDPVERRSAALPAARRRGRGRSRRLLSAPSAPTTSTAATCCPSSRR